MKAKKILVKQLYVDSSDIVLSNYVGKSFIEIPGEKMLHINVTCQIMQ